MNCLRVLPLKAPLTRRGVDVNGVFGVSFMLVVLGTVVINYSISTACGDACYKDSDTPTEYPDHLFISSALKERPTHFTGAIGFSLAAAFVVLWGCGRVAQVHFLACCVEDASLQEELAAKNRRSLKYMLVCAASLVVLSIFPPSSGGHLRDSVHYSSALFMFLTFVLFVFPQVANIEAELTRLGQDAAQSPVQIPFLHPDSSAATDRYVRSVRFKKRWLQLTVSLAVGMVATMILWASLENGTPAHNSFGVAACTLEILTVTSGCLFIGLSDFTVIQRVYGRFDDSRETSSQCLYA